MRARPYSGGLSRIHHQMQLQPTNLAVRNTTWKPFSLNF